MPVTRESRFQQVSQQLGYEFDGEIKIGGNYTPVLQHGNDVYISGQIPRVGDKVVITGPAGRNVALPVAQKAAGICVMRALALLRQHLGSLDHIQRILRLTVYVQSSADFTSQSEVANGASDILYFVLGEEAGAHVRTSIGVYQLPKNATVELELVAVSV
ncbi:RidA family protein [Leeia oryzae]|uniref:RidA family protein n=1 Tax=Leeia oryzae TaxID=356662 RepID=UPI00036335F0|nr:RidA family protein [Leeia oryzae]